MRRWCILSLRVVLDTSCRLISFNGSLTTHTYSLRIRLHNLLHTLQGFADCRRIRLWVWLCSRTKLQLWMLFGLCYSFIATLASDYNLVNRSTPFLRSMLQGQATRKVRNKILM